MKFETFPKQKFVTYIFVLAEVLDHLFVGWDDVGCWDVC